MKLPQSPRLIYRLLSRSEEDRGLLEILDSKDVNRQFFPGGALSTDGIADLQERFVSNYEKDETSVFLVFDKQENFIGRTGLFYTEDLKAIGLGYFVDNSNWGKGYATEMALALLQWAKENTDIKEIFAYAHVENKGSIIVMEKVGMEYVETRILKGIKCVLYKKNL